MIDTHQLAALSGFALVSSITPGPNNLMLMASGATYGFRRTLPHMLGVIIGFSLMIVVVGIALVGVFDAWPPAFTILKIVSAAYLLWLAWKIATAPAPTPGHSDSSGHPMTFIQAVLFQWVNPKAWTMALTATTLYASTRTVPAVILIAAVFGAMNFPVVGSWTAAGEFLAHWLTSGKTRLAFNWGMAALLVASLVVAL